MTGHHADDAAQIVGASVRRMRNIRGLTLAALAQASGAAQATLSTLERGQGNPTLDTLVGLSRALRVPVGELLGEGPDPGAAVVRAGAGAAGRRGQVDLCLVHRIALGPEVVELIDWRLAPHGRHNAAPHAGSEYLLLISGRLLAGPTAAPVEIGPGDLIVFHSSTPHCYEALGDEPVHAVAINRYPAGGSSFATQPPD
ncbi:MAG: helix-turn-helix domain-containing protein [Bifidobacteriaceae bacterium]|jgi:transcriptional regulator with XRE-family HTH domain|nr:helix-turn-helix domain-containing protein [Bifidobacteriaceae bacterium]